MSLSSFDRWLTTEPAWRTDDEPEWDEVEMPPMPDACPRCEGIGVHDEGCLFDGRCARPLRDGPCLMDEDHRGRCSTVVHYCDGCGQYRRGHPHAVARNPWDGEIEASFCWFCTEVTR